MPTYEYLCSAGHRYEKREGYDAPPAQRCAKCRRTARRVLQATAILFKGSGFYVTDSRKPAPSGAAGPALSAAEGPALSGAEGSRPSEGSDAKAEPSSAGKDSAKAKPSSAGRDSAAKDVEAAAAS